TERRNWVRILGLSILLGVILQGLLGGARVLADERLLAMLHGSLAAIVFSMMAAFAQVTSPGWRAAADQPPPGRDLRPLRAWALLLPAAILFQYMLGGLLRHLGMALHEHIGMAVLVLLLAVSTSIRAMRSGHSWIRSGALALFGVA